jgi:hypothetical protein
MTFMGNKVISAKKHDPDARVVLEALLFLRNEQLKQFRIE